MKQEFDQYLKQIGITELFYDRSKKLVELFSRLIGEEILDIFVSDFLDGEGKRNYEVMLLFTQQRIIEVKQFLRGDDYFINNVKNCRLTGLQIHAVEYDFERATGKSRLNCEAYFEQFMTIPIKASQEKCDHLNGILKKYFLR